MLVILFAARSELRDETMTGVMAKGPIGRLVSSLPLNIAGAVSNVGGAVAVLIAVYNFSPLRNLISEHAVAVAVGGVVILGVVLLWLNYLIADRAQLVAELAEARAALSAPSERDRTMFARFEALLPPNGRAVTWLRDSGINKSWPSYCVNTLDKLLREHEADPRSGFDNERLNDSYLTFLDEIRSFQDLVADALWLEDPMRRDAEFYWYEVPKSGNTNSRRDGTSPYPSSATRRID